MTFLKQYLPKISDDRNLIVLVVFITNVIDNLLTTGIVPIIPEILLVEDTKKETLHCETTYTTITGIGLGSLQHNKTKHGFTRKLLELSFNLATENSKIGWILASKALVQLFANPVAGYLANLFGNPIVLLSGTVILGISSIVYSIPSHVVGLLFARGIQGLGSAAITVAGMSLLAEKYSDDSERSRAMGKAMGGIALGVVIGYPFGGFLYAYVGHSAPFLIITLFVFIDIVLIVCVVPPLTLTKSSYMGTSFSTLIKDPYILIVACILMLTTTSISTLEALVPIWIIDSMQAEKWQLALVFAPDSLGYFVGTTFFGGLALRLGRWRVALVCLVTIGVCLFTIPFATKVTHLIVPHLGFGLGLGITDAAIMPLLALLVETRHIAVYGSVYAIAQLAVCLAYGLGPALAGQIVKETGFSGFMWGFSSLFVLLSPICLVLRNPPTEQENKPILDDGDTMQMYD